MDQTMHFHMKGIPDKILDLCSHYYEDNGERRHLNNGDKERFKGIVREMEDGAIHCIAYAHACASNDIEEMTLIGIFGLKDSCRPNTSKAIMECMQAGLNVKMLTKEDVTIAKASAAECRILSCPVDYSSMEDVIDGAELESYSEEELSEKAERLNVVANASTSNLLFLIKHLKRKGHVVATFHGCLDDEAVIKEADLVFSTGTAESHSIKEVIIQERSFTFIAKALRWGRGMYNNIQMYVQFQITATISSLIVDSVSTMTAGKPPAINMVTAITSGKVPLAALQLLWMKLMVGTLVSVALTTDDPVGI